MIDNLHGPIDKFFRDRGTHLAAMIAYFALLSLVPLIFLSLAILGAFGRAEESSYLVTELQALFPTQSIDDIVSVVRAIQRNAATLGILGAVFLFWARSRSSACSSRRSTSSTAAPTGPSCEARRSRSSCSSHRSSSSSRA